MSANTDEQISTNAELDGSLSQSKSKRKGEGRWTRIERACERCKKMKTRCDETRPCYHCRRGGHQCTPEKQASPKRTDLEERQVRTNTPEIFKVRKPSRKVATTVERLQRVRELIKNFRYPLESEHEGAMDLLDKMLASSRGAINVENTQTSPSVLPIVNEFDEKRWGGESSYPVSSEMLSTIEPRLRTEQNKSGLPGTDDDVGTEDSLKSPAFVDPKTVGFPSRELGLKFLEIFLETIHPCLSFLHANLCRRLVEELYSSGAGIIDTPNLAAHLALLALGAQSCQSLPGESIVGGGTEKMADSMYTKARLLMLPSWEKPCFPTLVSTVSLTLYQQAAGRSSAAWATFGICVRQAQALGLHRDTPNWDLSTSMREARRSTWLNIYTLDTFLSASYGRPPIIMDEHCDALPPSILLDDVRVLAKDPVIESRRQLSLMEICHASPSRMQFHLLKLHLCKIIRRLLSKLYLVPTSTSTMTLRQKWDVMKSITEDVEELRQSLPEHLQASHLEQYKSESPWQQQTIFLEILMHYTLILANRPLLAFRERTTEEHDIPESILASRRGAAQQASYRAACGISAMVTEERGQILGLTIQLLLSAWGIYSSAAELIALHAITAPFGSEDAKEAYRSLSIMLRHFAGLKERWPSSALTYRILQDLVRIVVAKVEAESRVGSPEPTMSTVVLEGNGVVDMDVQGGNLEGNPLEGIDMRWIDDFLSWQNPDGQNLENDQSELPADPWLWPDILNMNTG